MPIRDRNPLPAPRQCFSRMDRGHSSGLCRPHLQHAAASTRGQGRRISPSARAWSRSMTAVAPTSPVAEVRASGIVARIINCPANGTRSICRAHRRQSRRCDLRGAVRFRPLIAKIRVPPLPRSGDRPPTRCLRRIREWNDAVIDGGPP
jgi:hypothetical protein